MIKTGILATTLAASALVSTASPAMARGYYRHHDDTAGVAIGAGIIGLAVGALVASNHDDRYRDARHYQAIDGRYHRDDRYYEQARRYDDTRYYDGDRGWQRQDDSWDNGYYGRRGY
jgi:hypothetical protein